MRLKKCRWFTQLCKDPLVTPTFLDNPQTDLLHYNASFFDLSCNPLVRRPVSGGKYERGGLAKMADRVHWFLRVLVYESQMTGRTPVATWPGACPSRTRRTPCTGWPTAARTAGHSPNQVHRAAGSAYYLTDASPLCCAALTGCTPICATFTACLTHG